MNTPCYYRVSVKALVFDDQGRMLLCRENDGMWDLLGGGLDHDEDPIECLKREVKEESGLEILTVSKEPKYFVTFYTVRDSKKYYKANIIYEVKFKNLNFVESAECQEIKFFHLNEIENIKPYPNVKKLIKLLPG